jgi:hypothetical protein
MTPVDVVFRYGAPPTEEDMRAIAKAREVYGVRRVSFNEKEMTVRVEYDATRLHDDSIAALLRGAGLDLREKIALV